MMHKSNSFIYLNPCMESNVNQNKKLRPALLVVVNSWEGIGTACTVGGSQQLGGYFNVFILTCTV